MAAPDLAVKHVQGLLIERARNFDAAFPVPYCLIRANGGSEHRRIDAGEEGGFLLRNLAGGRAAHPFPGLTVGLDEPAAGFASQKLARATQAAERDRRH